MKKRGFIAITSVLIISAILLSVTLSLSSRSIGETTISAGMHSSHNARVLSQACLEHTLLKLQRVLDYAGNEEIVFGQGACSVLPIEGSGNDNRIVRIHSTSSEYVYRTEVTLSQISPTVTIESREYVSTF